MATQALYQVGRAKVLPCDNVCFPVNKLSLGCRQVRLPFTALMTNLICVVSVAHVK
jgi:hypothetical protein